MLGHFAEHLEAQGDLGDSANLHLSSVYYGCGSCVADGVEDSLCENNGVTTCDKVC
jgi:hypothetical protein